jgi:hypothetical protein
VELEYDHPDAAGARFRESLDVARELGYRELVAYGLKGMAEVAAATGDATRAARTLGVAEALFAELLAA